jgi:3-hydroxyisobutyrate dehydrogenase
MIKTIAFIGLGNMGCPMAANLVKAGFEVTGFDVSPAARAHASARGIKLADSVSNAAEQADAVITMLPNATLVLDVWKQLASVVLPGKLVVDSSTIDVENARLAHGLLTGRLTVDAPVSGGTVGAEAATLSFMAGGEAVAIEAAGPILAAMGGRIIACGDAGSGQAAKLCNNMLLGISMIGAAEAFVLGEKLGLDHQALFDVISTSSGQCWAVNVNCPVPGPVPASPANRDYRPGFATSLMLKDLRLAAQAALACEAATPLGAEARRIYEMFEQSGNGDQDFSAIVKFLRQDRGVAPQDTAAE